MQHDRGCVCQECTSTSTTDTVLVGILIISGVVIAISTGSKWFVNYNWSAHIGKGYRRVLVEVMKPAPQAKCIVGIIANNEKYSLTDFAISSDESKTKPP